MPGPGWTLDQFRALLGQDLAEGTLRDVVAELDHIQNGRLITQSVHPEILLQGDIYRNALVVIRDGADVSLQARRAMLVSNSCDVGPNNRRDLPVLITIAPVVRLARFREMLSDNGVAQARIESVVQSLKVQELSTMIYVPDGPGVEEPLVVMLSDVQSMSIEAFQLCAPVRDAVLTARGWWLLLVKLAMHYCRPYEGIDRNAA